MPTTRALPSLCKVAVWLPLLAMMCAMVAEAICEEARLMGADSSEFDLRGSAVALSPGGERVFVGAPGHRDVYYDTTTGSVSVYDWSADAGWVEEAVLEPSGSAYDFFGNSISLSDDGERAIIGSRNNAAFAFLLTNEGWIQEATLVPDEVAEFFGFTVALSGNGDRALVGAPNDSNEDGVQTGSVFVFARSASEDRWVQEGKLVPGDASRINNIYGQALALSRTGDRAIVGLSDKAAAYVYAWSGTAWLQEAKLQPANLTSRSSFGRSAAMSPDGDFVTVGASGAEAVYSFAWDETTESWIEGVKIVPADGGTGYSEFGASVAVSSTGERLAVGAPLDNDGGDFAGTFHMFAWNGTAFVEEAKVNGTVSSRLGSSVSLSWTGERVAVGSTFEDNGAGFATVFLNVSPCLAGELSSASESPETQSPETQSQSPETQSQSQSPETQTESPETQSASQSPESQSPESQSASQSLETQSESPETQSANQSPETQSESPETQSASQSPVLPSGSSGSGNTVGIVIGPIAAVAVVGVAAGLLWKHQHGKSAAPSSSQESQASDARPAGAAAAGTGTVAMSEVVVYPE